jgi:hypothetical protein
MSQDPNLTRDSSTIFTPSSIDEIQPNELPAIPGYDILEEVGRGGMGVVYQARHLALNRVVAIKMILSAELASPEQLLRFRMEAEMAARVHHPNVVEVYEIGRWRDRPFVEQEWVGDGTLARKLAGKPQPPGVAAILVEKLARAIHAAHLQGVVHRDLKPANVLMSGEEPKIADFGLAKPIRGSTGLTATGAIMGTPEYMAPEQAAGEKEVGPAADIYSLGVILYECLVGRPPFRGGNILETLQQVQHSEPPTLRSANQRIPRDLETICLRCLNKDPKKRYPSAEALAEDLRRWREGMPISARRVGEMERLWLWARRRPAIASLLATVAILLIVGTVVSSLLAWRAETNAGIARGHEREANRNLQTAKKNAALAKTEAEIARQARDAARASEAKAQRTLADMYTVQGLQASRLGDDRQAALWFAQAAIASGDDTHRREANRIRMRAWSRRVSQPTAAMAPQGKIAQRVMFHPKNRYLISELVNLMVRHHV